MKAYEILNEDSDIDYLIKYIKKYCKPYLEEIKNVSEDHYLKRGVRVDKDYFVSKVNKQRKPKDSSIGTHKTFNWLIKQNDLKANRSNSVFCTSDISMAMAYGTVYYTFPIGNFNYTWMRNTDDWHIIYGGRGTLYFDDEYYEELLYNRYNTHIQDKLHELYTKLNNTDDKKEVTNIKKQIKSYENKLDEITSYVSRDLEKIKDKMTSDDYYNPKNILPRVKKEFEKNLAGDDGSLIEALKSGNETMIHCDKVLYIKKEVFEKYIYDELFGEKN